MTDEGSGGSAVLERTFKRFRYLRMQDEGGGTTTTAKTTTSGLPPSSTTTTLHHRRHAETNSVVTHLRQLSYASSDDRDRSMIGRCIEFVERAVEEERSRTDKACLEEHDLCMQFLREYLSSASSETKGHDDYIV